MSVDAHGTTWKVGPDAVAAGVSGSWDWDIPQRRLRFDAALAALFGFDAETAAEGLDPSAFFSAIHPQDVARVRIAVAGVLRGVEIFSKSFRILAPEGTIRWVEADGRCHLDAEEQPARFTGVVVDVTGRRRIEERLRVAQTAGRIGTFEYSPGFATAMVSEQFCGLLGLQSAGVLPVRTINQLSGPGQPLILEGKRRPGGENFYDEICVNRADGGGKRWIARRGEVIEEGDGSGGRHLGVIYDITETKQVQEDLRQLNETLELRVEQEVARRLETEEALRQAQKMEAVGQLTGGIAHDFNNLLTVIMGNLDMAVRRLGSSGDERIERALSNAVKGAERAATLTQRLLAFSRRQPLDPKQIDISRLLRGMTDLLGRSLGERVKLVTDAPAGLWHVEVDPNQLENALLNLAVNARDAMDGEGSLAITAANAMVGEEPGGPAAGEYVLLEVTDSGSGMDEETIARAFDPFYTTKEVGKGTGLGLSMVYGFVTQSGGHINILSRLGEGTSVRLFLPRLNAPHAAEQDVRDGAEGRVGSSETILVVEDDEDVRAYAVEGLRDLGYQVVEATDGASALTALRREGERIELVLTDVIMPGMSGRDLADAARAVRPGLRVLYTSGYPRDVIVRDGRLETGVDLLPKPFTYTALAAKVRDMLDR